MWNVSLLDDKVDNLRLMAAVVYRGSQLILSKLWIVIFSPCSLKRLVISFSVLSVFSYHRGLFSPRVIRCGVGLIFWSA